MWLQTSPAQKYGASVASTAPATRDATAITSVAPRVQHPAAGFTSPSQPGFWFAVIAAGTVFLMGYSTTSRK